MAERRARRRPLARVKVADAVSAVVGRPGMESLLGDLDDLYCCERRQDVIDTRTDVAIALSVEVSAAPGWRVHRLVVTHATCAPSQVRRALDLRDQPVQQAAENQRPGHLLGLRPACGVPSALVMWEITGQLLHWPAPAGKRSTVVDETVQVLHKEGLLAVNRPAQLEQLVIATGWRLDWSTRRFALRDAHGNIACTGPLLPDADGWQKAVRREGFCLALAGVGLGLGTREHFGHLLVAMQRGGSPRRSSLASRTTGSGPGPGRGVTRRWRPGPRQRSPPEKHP